jgi:hypothetical protein
VTQELENVTAGARVEACDGLVGEQDEGVEHEGADDADSLLLAARENADTALQVSRLKVDFLQEAACVVSRWNG